MKKSIIKTTAAAVLTAVTATCFPINDIYAAPSFVFPAAGVALAAGNGCSIQDIRANVARNAAKHGAITTHEKITKSEQSTVAKVETPSSKAVNEGLTIDGVAVVGSASEGATIEITSDDAATTSSGMNGGDDSELAETAAPEDEAKKSESEANPQIDVKPEMADVEEGEEDLSDQVIAVVDGYVNVRSMPDENSEVVGKLYNHSAGTWLDKQGDWYKIESGNVVGFVKGEYVKTGQAAVKLAAEVGQRTAVVHTTTLKIREEASIDSSVLGLVANEDQLTVIEETDEWVKVNIEEGDGWVSRNTSAFPRSSPRLNPRLKRKQDLRRKLPSVEKLRLQRQGVQAARRRTAVRPVAAADHTPSAAADSEQVLPIMLFSLSVILMYTAEPALRTEQTAQDLRWAFTGTSVYPCRTRQVHSARWVTVSEVLRRHSPAISSATADMSDCISAADRSSMHRQPQRVSRYPMLLIVIFLLYEGYSKKRSNPYDHVV